MPTAEIFDVVMRFHDVRRLNELDRAIFSLVTQRHCPTNIILVTQRFTEEEIEQTRNYLSAVLSIAEAPTLKILNFSEPEPKDARSTLINIGIQNSKGRYLSFLDYDDFLYPEAYERLVPRVRDTQAAIAFGGINIHHVDIFPAYSYQTGAGVPFKGQGIIDLFHENFCPIHSFVIDRTKVLAQDLFFEPDLHRNEDYDFLLRICARYLADFAHCKMIIGSYCLKNDGSNSILTGSTFSEEARRVWDDAEAFMEARRRTMPISSIVQRSLGLEPDPNLTIRGLLKGRLKRVAV